MDLIKASLKKTKLIGLFVSLFILGFAGFVFWIGFSGVDTTASDFTNNFLVILGVFFGLVGGALFYVYFRPNPLVRLIQSNPMAIEKIERQEVRSLRPPYRITSINLIFHVSDGKRYPIMISVGSLDAFVGEIKKLLPKAQWK
jgi:hypothetical protein